jgi:group I intron endonuclease
MTLFILLIKSALSIAASYLRITAIYFNRIAFHILLYSGVVTLIVMLLGSGLGGLESLFQVTNFLTEVKALQSIIFDLFVNTIYCDAAEELPVVIEFSNLHKTEQLVEAYERLKGLAGIYCVKNIVTGAMYIGSSINLALRVRSHITDSTNVHLKKALKKHGIINFVFLVVELVEISEELTQEENKAILLAREQLYLNWLFALHASLRYNFLPTAGSPLGYKHTEESKAKMSSAMMGKNTGKEPVNKGTTLSEAQRLLLIKASQHRYKPVYFYDDANNLITMYPSLNATCKAEQAQKNNMVSCIRTGRLFRGYHVTYTPIN